MNTPKQISELYYSQLKDIYSKREISNIIQLVFFKLKSWNRIDISLNNKLELLENESDKYIRIIDRLKQYEPIQYILKESTFCDLNIIVNSSVLIPRPETEELVYLIIDKISNNNKVLDIGTGSGCIALALKNINRTLDVSAIDISKSAIDIAINNANNLDLDVNFYKEDIFEINNTLKFSCIVSNPPYIPNEEYRFMSKNVLNYEPKQALFVPDNNPLKFYKKIAEFAKKNLCREGYLFFEIHEDMAKKIEELLVYLGFNNIVIHKDFQDKDRIVYCQR